MHLGACVLQVSVYMERSEDSLRYPSFLGCLSTFGLVVTSSLIGLPVNVGSWDGTQILMLEK